MSTRCQIIVKGADVVVYRHSDGYPETKHGVLAALLRLLREFTKYRGFDVYYLPAQILSGFVKKHQRWVASMIRTRKKAGQDTASYQASTFLDYGTEAYTNENADNAFHGDIEFLYVVHSDHVEVRSCFVNEGEGCNIGNTALVKSVTFDGADYVKVGTFEGNVKLAIAG